MKDEVEATKSIPRNFPYFTKKYQEMEVGTSKKPVFTRGLTLEFLSSLAGTYETYVLIQRYFTG